MWVTLGFQTFRIQTKTSLNSSSFLLHFSFSSLLYLSNSYSPPTSLFKLEFLTAAFLTMPLTYFTPTSNLSARTVNSTSKAFLHLAGSVHLSLFVQIQVTSTSNLYCNHCPTGFPATLLYNPVEQLRMIFNKWISNNVTSLLKTTQWLPIHLK